MTRSHIALAAMFMSAALTASTTLRAQARPQTELRAAIELEENKGDVAGAIERYKRLAQSGDRAVAAQALLRLANAYQRLGDVQARSVYERVLRDFADQKDVVSQAAGRLEQLQGPARRSPATRQVWIAEGGVGRPSQDGRYLPMQWGGTGDLALRDLRTNTTRFLTNSGGWVASGDFVAETGVISPDNSLLAYTWWVEQSNTRELRVQALSADSKEPRVLMSGRIETIAAMAFTPDSRRLIVIRRDGEGRRLVAVDVSSGRFEVIKVLNPRGTAGVSLSPDGRWLAYEDPVADGNRDIVVMAIDGSRQATLVGGAPDDYNALWSPDSSQLVFQRREDGRTGFWAMPVRDGQPAGSPVLVKSDAERMVPLGITRGGALFYRVAGNVRQNVFVASLKDGVASGQPTLIPGHAGDASMGPSWSPDGESLTYWATAPRPALVIRSMKTGLERAIALPAGVPTGQSGPRWFPDGRSVLVAARDAATGATGFARFNVDSGMLESLHQSPLTANPVSYALAPDGGAIFWAVQATSPGGNDGRSGRVMRFDLKNREERVLKRDEWFLSVAVSPDGSQIAYLKHPPDRRANNLEAPGVLEVMSSQGGEARAVFRDPIWYSGNRYNTLTWAPDGRSLLVVRDEGGLWRIPLDGTAPQRTGLSGTAYDFKPFSRAPATSPERRIKSPAVHPDGRSIAFNVGEGHAPEIWSLENFLPTPGRK